MPSSIEKVYSKLRQRIAAALRKNLWLAAFATVAACAVLAATIVLRSHWLIVIAAAAGVVVTAFVWGYTTRAFRVPPWPTLGHLQRRQYAETWDTMASSSRTARIAVSGKAWEWELRDSTREPIRNLIELASISEKDDVLEIACGIARLGLELAPLCHSWTGADISANMLAHAAERVKGVGNVKLHQLHGDGLAGLADDSFDVVYCTNTLAHLDELDRWRYVQEAFRVLRVGGRIFIDNIDLESDQGWASFLGLVAKYLNAEQPPYMTRFSTASELMTYATRAGFEQVRSHERPPLVIMTAVKPSAAG